MEDLFNIKTSGSNLKVEENPTTKVNVDTISAFEGFGIEHSLDGLMNQINAKNAATGGKNLSKDEVKELVGVKKDNATAPKKEQSEDTSFGSAFDDFFSQIKSQAIIESISNEIDKWGKLLAKFKPNLMQKFYLSLLGSAIEKSENNVVTLSLQSDDFNDVIQYKNQIKMLEKLMSEVSHRDIKVSFVKVDDVPEKSPRKQRQKIYEEKCNETWDEIEKTEGVELLKQAFSAEIVRDYRFCALRSEADPN